jgi:hypothetical protein
MLDTRCQHSPRQIWGKMPSEGSGRMPIGGSGNARNQFLIMREILACPCICINSRIFFTAYHDIQLGNQALVQPAFELDVS